MAPTDSSSGVIQFLPLPNIYTHCSKIRQLISTDEMERYVEMINPYLRDRYFQHLIRGWMKFVAPLTPSNVEDVPHLKCVQDAQSPVEHIPESICMLLAAVSKTAYKAEGQLSRSALLPFSKAWPTVWIWTQHMYHVHWDRLDLLRLTMDAAQKSHFTERYDSDDVIGGILRSLINHAKQPVISKILSDHPEIFAMMADMWIREAKDKEAVYGFRYGVYSEPADPSEQRFVAQIILACGGAEEAVNLACQRVERNTGRTTQDNNTRVTDLHFFAASMSNAECPIAPAMLASSRVARLLMRAWAHAASELFSAPVELRDAYMDICMSGITMLLRRSPRAYEILRDILNHDFIPLCLNSIPMVRSGSGDQERFIREASTVLHIILPSATVHREIFSIMKLSMTSPKLKFFPKDQHDVLSKPCGMLWRTLHHRLNAYKEYRQDRSCCVLLCGNTKCGNAADGEILRRFRCSACMLSFYCSRNCQKEHWRVGHKVLCNAMKGKIEDCVDLSYPDLHFLSYLIANDLKVQKVRIASWRELLPKENRYTGRPGLFLNFLLHDDDHLASMQRMDANVRSNQFPFLDDAFLYNEWCRLFDVPSEVLPVLVAIQRGANGTVQVMTALMYQLDGDVVGIRWLHCHVVFVGAA